uniref:Reverse transcriptase domain-containing protein n=1 Tax=Lactuca sativa TaxID=4236 RepID=A0A9R1VAN4_LACSA|nr:hypothetical protein LSAT_V11C500233290 [Lactuca sativa]
MSTNDEEKTAFYTDNGTFCYTKMPFRLKNAGATYERLVDSLFTHQIGRNIEVYVEDMVIKILNESKLLRDVEETLQTLEGAKMKLNSANCTFGVEEGQFLGYCVTKEGIQSSPTKINELKETPSPCTLRDTQGLNAKQTTLSQFISKLDEKAMPLINTLKGCIEKNNFRWTTEAKSALQKIKMAIHTLRILASLIPGEKLQVYLSTSKDTISSVLVVERQGHQLLLHGIKALPILPGPPHRGTDQLPNQAGVTKAGDIQAAGKVGHRARRARHQLPSLGKNQGASVRGFLARNLGGTPTRSNQHRPTRTLSREYRPAIDPLYRWGLQQRRVNHRADFNKPHGRGSHIRIAFRLPYFQQ